MTDKLAYGPVEARKVLDIAKSRMLPKGLGRQQLERGVVAGGQAASPQDLAKADKAVGMRVMWPQQHGETAALIRQSIPEELAVPSMRANDAMNAGTPVSGILQPESTTKAMGRHGLTKGLDPANKQMVESITKGHELDELQVRPAFGVQGFGHRSPDVLLREHNRITTLPEEFRPAGDVYRALRGNMTPEKGALDEFLKDYGFSYGESPRVSRHMRKHLTNAYSATAQELAGAKLAHMSYDRGQYDALIHLGFEKEAFAGHLMAGLRAAAPAMSNAGKAIGMGVRSAGGAGRAAVGAAKGVAQNGGVTSMRQAAGAASQQGMQQAGQAFGQAKGHLGDAYTAMQPHLADAGKAIKGYGTSAMNMASMAMPAPGQAPRAPVAAAGA